MANFFSNLFGGGAERDAANRNRGEVNRYSTNSLNTFDDALRRSSGAIQDYGQNARNYYGDAYNQYGGMRDRGMDYLDSGRDNSLAALNRGRSNYDSLDALAGKYGGATSLLLDSLGVNGAEGATRAQNQFQAGPGYQFTLDQGLQALNRRRAAAGMLNSGNADVDALTYGTGLANQTYGSWQDRLAGFRDGELGATNAAASGRSSFDKAISDLYQSDAASRVGLDNAATSGQAGVAQGRAQNEQWMGNSLANLYSQDAQNRTGVYGNVASGNMAANNLQAQGQSQGARNLLGAGMGLASLATGAFGSGGMFGSGGAFGNSFNGGGSGGYNPGTGWGWL